MLRSALLASLVLAGLPGAQATASDASPTVTVPHADLDLARPADRRTLDRRVRKAVTVVCPGNGIELRVSVSIVRCRQVATLGAMRQVREAVAAAAGTSTPARFAGNQEDDRS